MFHYRSSRQKYISFPAHDRCPFCDAQSKKESIAETKHTRIVKNRVSYDLWELRQVTDHLLLLPKRHVLSFSALTKEEKLDVITTIGEYEDRGYNVYARAPTNAQRSVPHQHTHLIKTEGPQGKFMLFIKKPYFLFKR